MSIFDLFFLFLIFGLLVSLFQAVRMPRARQKRLRDNEDSLKQTQNLSRQQAAVSGMGQRDREAFEDSMTLSVCFARFALRVAYADGYLSPNEVASIFSFFNGANPDLVSHMHEVLEKDIMQPSAIDWDYNLAEARRVLGKAQWAHFSAVMFDGLLAISMSDGVVESRELEIIFGIMAQLGWTKDRMEGWFRTRTGFSGSFGASSGNGSSRSSASAFNNDATRLRDAYSVLGLQPGAGPEAVKKRYRELARENHPDRYAQMGEEMQKTATRRFQTIQEAYDYVMKSQK